MAGLKDLRSFPTVVIVRGKGMKFLRDPMVMTTIARVPKLCGNFHHLKSNCSTQLPSNIVALYDTGSVENDTLRALVRLR